MHRLFALIVALAVVALAAVPRAAFAQTSPAPMASPSITMAPVAVPSSDPAVTARAKEWLHRAQTGTIDRAQLTAQMNTALTDDLMKQVETQLAPLGDPIDFALVDMRSVAGSNVYLYKAQFKSSRLEELLSIDASGKINGLRFLPAQ